MNVVFFSDFSDTFCYSEGKRPAKKSEERGREREKTMQVKNNVFDLLRAGLIVYVVRN